MRYVFVFLNVCLTWICPEIEQTVFTLFDGHSNAEEYDKPLEYEGTMVDHGRPHGCQLKVSTSKRCFYVGSMWHQGKKPQSHFFVSLKLTGAQQGMREWSIITSNNHLSNPHSHPFSTFSTSKKRFLKHHFSNCACSRSHLSRCFT